MANWYNEQLTNNNYLSPIGFLFVLDKAKKVSFLCQRASIPDLTLGNVDLPTRGLVPIPTEGNIQYGELTIDFTVPENLDIEKVQVIIDTLKGINRKGKNIDALMEINIVKKDPK